MADEISTTQQLYNDLLSLCGQNLGLFYTDEISGMGEPVRTFSYKQGVSTDTWSKTSALSCSGVSFVMNSDKTMKDIICRPMDKFFSYVEGEYGIDSTTTAVATVKQDGVSVSSYMSDGYLYLKTKSSIYSNNAVLAMQTLNKPDYSDLRQKIQTLDESGYTCNLEYVSPKNRNVILYTSSDLIFLNARNRETGEYISFNDSYADAVLRKYMTQGSTITDIPDWITQAYSEPSIEGFVVELATGERFKVKTTWYNYMLNLRNSITDNGQLYSAIASGSYQDVYNLVQGYDYAVAKVKAFEDKFLSVVDGATQAFLSIYKTINGKERGNYVIGAITLSKSYGYSWIGSLLIKNYNLPIDYNSLVDNISQLFTKNYSLYIPKGYEAAIDNVPRDN